MVETGVDAETDIYITYIPYNHMYTYVTDLYTD